MVTENKSLIDISPRNDGGILKEIIREGTGDEKPLPGDTVFVHYVGTLEADGSQFDSSRDRGEQFSFQAGKNMVIKGWDLGVPTMKRNELAKFTIKPEFGYGNTGSPPKIPKNATLIFEIELFDWHGEDLSESGDKSIIKRQIREGAGYESPNDGSRVIINIKCSDEDGKVYDNREKLEFELGEGADVDVPASVELALTKSKKEEISRLVVKSHRAWGTIGNKKLGIAPNTDLIYEIELIGLEKAKESWQLNGKEKLEQSELLKKKGSDFFKKEKYDSAIKKYTKILDFLQNETFDLEEDKEASRKLQIAAHLNKALCELKQKEFRQAIHTCNKALELEQNSEKAYFRIASAYYGLSEYSDAIESAEKVLGINKENKDASNLIAFSKQKIVEYKNKEKSLYKKMFNM